MYSCLKPNILGFANSNTTTFPPGFTTRCISDNTCLISGTLRIAKPLIAASNVLSAYGNAIASPWTRLTWSSKPASSMRTRPWSSISLLKSKASTFNVGSWRNASFVNTQVPQATSSIRWFGPIFIAFTENLRQ